MIMNMNQVYQDLGMTSKVNEFARRAYSLAPNIMEANLLMGSAQYTLGDLEAAASFYK